ncbi:MAG: alpha/beta hydrolase [Gammaproteobacteria bacterium]
MATGRRSFLKAALLAGLSPSLLPGTAVRAQSSTTIKRVLTPVLEIAYEEHGPATGFPVILLHGFPYDPRSFDGVVSPLAAAGYRVLVPYLRGYGPTRFRDADAPRMAEQAAIAQDLIDFADAMNISQFAVAGFDWGNRAACIAAIVQPERIRAQLACGGYSVQNLLARGGPAPAQLEASLWYQWYFNTERGVRGLQQNRHDIIRYLWDTWSPGWQYSDEDYARSAPSFDNADFVDVVIHSYRHRHGNAPGEDRFLELERELALQPPITVPAIVLRGLESGFGRPSENPAADQARFTNLVARRLVEGAGHDLPAHRPDVVLESMLQLLAA